MSAPRYIPDAPLPGIPYLPGINEKDPQFQLLPRDSDAHWSQTSGYLHGIDLFNHGCYWEAHEAWEDLWLPLEKEDPVRVFIQGLIQGSAALLKTRLNQPRSANSIWSRGKNRLSSVDLQQPDGTYHGFPVELFCNAIDAILKKQDPDFDSPKMLLKDRS